jgi:hypothetical protein
VTTIHNDDIFISMRLVLLIPTTYHTGVCNSVKANLQKSFVGHPAICNKYFCVTFNWPIPRFDFWLVIQFFLNPDKLFCKPLTYLNFFAFCGRGRRGRDRMVVGLLPIFIIKNAIFKVIWKANIVEFLD